MATAVRFGIGARLGALLIAGSMANVAFASVPSGVSELDEGASRGSGSSSTRYVLDVDRASFDSVSASHALTGRELVDIEVLWDGTEERYCGIFRPVAPGVTVHKLIQQSPSNWSTFLSQMGAKQGRFLDLEVGYFDGQKLYSAIFLEDGDDYGFAVYSTNSDLQFYERIEEQLRLGRQLIDFEAYDEPGYGTRYAGVWVRDPKQPMTHLYRGLKTSEFSDLLAPLAGRVLDVERYETLWGSRFAILVAQVPSGEWGVYRAMSSVGLSNQNSAIGDQDTDLIDIDFFQSFGTYYDAVWGNAPKSLQQIAPMPGEPDFDPPSPALQAEIDDFEDGVDGGTGLLGVYARNMRSKQSTGHEIDRPLYLASLAKTAIHLKLFREAQAGRLNWNSTTPYTNGADRRDPWWVDDRSESAGPGDSEQNPNRPGFGPPHFGQWFSLARFDRAMMQVSDNAATSLLVDDDQFGVANDAENLNEWIASLPGVGPEFGLVTSIQDVDRFELWQGQQPTVLGYGGEISYLAPPPWAVTAFSRAGDQWCDLADYLEENYDEVIDCPGGGGYPLYGAQPWRQYQAMGLNSASPRAVGNLYEALWDGELLNVHNTVAALDIMLRNPTTGLESTSFDNHPSFPSGIQIFAKDGRKSNWGVNTEGGLLVLGPDAISLTILSNENSRALGCDGGSGVSCRFGDIAYQVLQQLGTDLVGADSSITFDQVQVLPGDDFDASCTIVNFNGGDAQAFDVGFYASTNSTITTAFDHLIGTVRIDGLDGFDSVSAALDLDSFPADIPPGDYHVGCIADPKGPGDSWGEVGEIDESTTSNNTNGSTAMLRVLVPPPPPPGPPPIIFVDGFEAGDVSAWQ